MLILYDRIIIDQYTFDQVLTILRLIHQFVFIGHISHVHIFFIYLAILLITILCFGNHRFLIFVIYLYVFFRSPLLNFHILSSLFVNITCFFVIQSTFLLFFSLLKRNNCSTFRFVLSYTSSNITSYYTHYISTFCSTGE